MKNKFLFVMFVLFISIFLFVGCNNEEVDEIGKITVNTKTEILVGEQVELDFDVEWHGEGLYDVLFLTEDNDCFSFSDHIITGLKPGTGKIGIHAAGDEVEFIFTIVENPNKITMEYELNGGTCENLVTERGTDTYSLPTPTKEGASFEGWYSSADFSGEKIEELNVKNMNITKLYAKWGDKTYKVVYNLTDVNGKTTKEEVVVEWAKAYSVIEKKVSSSEIFSGWYKEKTLINEVKEIEASSCEEDVLNLYGTVVDSNSKFDINLVYNGGSTTYETREEMIADFLNDYNYVIKTKYQTIKQIGITSTNPLTFHTFYAGVTEDGDNVSEKWGWLYRYVYDVSVKNLDSDSYIIAGLKGLLITNKATLSDSEKKGISCGVRAFLMGMKIGTGQLQSVDFTDYNKQNNFWSYLSECEKKEISYANSTKLPSPMKENFTFVGWFRDSEGTQGPVNNVFNSCTLYAKYEENIKVDEIKINEKTATLLKFKTLQLEWTISPSDASVRNITFTSSDPTVATIDEDGLINACGMGKTTIRVASNSESGKYDEFELQVYTADFIQASYDTASYVTVGETIKLNATPQGLYGYTKKLVWTSLDESIATVSDGVVTGVKDGFVKIRAAIQGEESDYFDFGVTVLDKNASDIKKFIASQNQGNVFFRYDLGIGSGTPVYYTDIIGSVSKLLFNTPYEINRTYEAKALAMTCHGGVKSSTEFITVHYTGNMNVNTNALMHAKYFTSSGVNVSIHYCTGNDGIYHLLDDTMVAWHAGDGTDVTFTWTKTGVKVKEGDPQYPVIEISKNSKYIINGVESNIDVPEGETEETKKVTGNTFVYQGVTQNCINDMGLSFRIVDGEYEMGTTYWNYNQVKAGRICNHGGNNNSIGIESAVDKGSDLWFTWQTTARLVAHLMQENNLDITRVVGHHFYSAKDCPQPMLENDLEIWYEFKKLVEAEYELLTKYSNYEITMAVNDGVTNVANTGRVTKQLGNTTQSMNYTVTIKNKTTGQVETVTLGSIIQGAYEK